MNKRGKLQNVGYHAFFTPSAIAKLSFVCDGEVTSNAVLSFSHAIYAKQNPREHNPWGFID